MALLFILIGLCDYLLIVVFFFFFKQKTAYEMRISDWSSDVCSSDLLARAVLIALDEARVACQLCAGGQRSALVIGQSEDVTIEPLFKRFKQSDQRRSVPQNLEETAGAFTGLIEICRQKNGSLFEIGD